MTEKIDNTNNAVEPVSLKRTGIIFALSPAIAGVVYALFTSMTRQRGGSLGSMMEGIANLFISGALIATSLFIFLIWGIIALFARITEKSDNKEE